jgi:hypothetical protein
VSVLGSQAFEALPHSAEAVQLREDLCGRQLLSVHRDDVALHVVQLDDLGLVRNLVRQTDLLAYPLRQDDPAIRLDLDLHRPGDNVQLGIFPVVVIFYRFDIGRESLEDLLAVAIEVRFAELFSIHADDEVIDADLVPSRGSGKHVFDQQCFGMRCDEFGADTCESEVVVPSGDLGVGAGVGALIPWLTIFAVVDLGDQWTCGDE